MIFVKIGERLLPAQIAGRMKDPAWDDRESKSITLEMTHEDAVETFVDGLEWSVVHEDENGNTVPLEDNTEFCLSGSITDHRDGTITVKMGKLTELEETLEIIYGGAV